MDQSPTGDRSYGPAPSSYGSSRPPHAQYGTASKQLPPAQPHFDPFQKRDPFMPSSQPERRDSVGETSARWGIPTSGRPSEPQMREVLQPAPGPPSPFHARPPLHYRDDNGRPDPTAEPHAQRPSSFLTRQMPPPSSPPGQNSNPAPPSSMSRGHLPAPIPPPRSGNNMSISSIMGSDNDPQPARHPSYSSSKPQPSSYAPYESSYRWEENPYRHENTGPSTAPPSDWRPGRRSPKPEYGAIGNRSRSPLVGSPEYGRHHVARPYGTNGSSGLPPRPYSQPRVLDGPPPRQSAGDNFRASLQDRTQPDHPLGDAYGPLNGPRYPRGPNSPPPRWKSPSRRYGVNTDADQPFGVHGQPADPLEPVAGPSQLQDARSAPNNPHQHPAGRNSVADSHDARSDSQSTTVEDSQSTKPYLDMQLRKSLEESQMSHRSIFGLSQDSARRVDRSSPLPQAVQGASSQPVGLGRDPGIKTEFGRMFSGLGSGVGSTPAPMAPSSHGSPTPEKRHSGVDEQDINGLSRAQFDGDGPRSIGRGNRRTKRSYMESQSDDEEISGYGMGVGIGRAGKRNRTGMAAQHHHHHAVTPGHQYALTPNNAKLGADAVYSHHHHHFRNDAVAAAASSVPLRRTTSSPYSVMRFPGQPSAAAASSSMTSTPLHHHHHHHHHHAAAGAAGAAGPGVEAPRGGDAPRGPALALRRPVLSVTSESLLTSVAQHERRHLGSVVYSNEPVLPAVGSTSVDSKFITATHSGTLPRLEGKENCTLTVRIPRVYVTPDARELACFQRQVWGTEVYSDDSDVLAACIHAGFIRGKWTAEVDESLLEFGTGGSEVGGVGANGPAAPPPNREAHVTLLVLPALERYAPSTAYGLRSRAWGSNHDGMSFKILSVAWADELGSDSVDAAVASTKSLNGSTGARTARTGANGVGEMTGSVNGSVGGNADWRRGGAAMKARLRVRDQAHNRLRRSLARLSRRAAAAASNGVVVANGAGTVDESAVESSVAAAA